MGLIGDNKDSLETDEKPGGVVGLWLWGLRGEDIRAPKAPRRIAFCM